MPAILNTFALSFITMYSLKKKKKTLVIGQQPNCLVAPRHHQKPMGSREPAHAR